MQFETSGCDLVKDTSGHVLHHENTNILRQLQLSDYTNSKHVLAPCLSPGVSRAVLQIVLKVIN